MKSLQYAIIIVLIFIVQTLSAQTKKSVESFSKVIISPHIQATFIEGNEESVVIEESKASADKINIEVHRNTLRVYLEDAKETTKTEIVVKNGKKVRQPIYKGKILTVTVTYKKLNALSIRGEQETRCKSNIDTEVFELRVYGESVVVFDAVNFQEFDVVVYGESSLEIKKGSTKYQDITAYGEGKIDLLNINNETTKLKAFGEAHFKIQSSKRIKLSAYGEAILQHRGTAVIDKGIHIGGVQISQID